MGTGFPAFHNDEAGILMMLNKGVPLPEAYHWNPCGCVETSLAGKQRCYTSYADYNLGMIVEFALNDGKSRKYGRTVVAAYESLGRPYAFAGLPPMQWEEARALVAPVLPKSLPFEVRIAGTPV